MQCPLRSDQATTCQLPSLEFKDSSVWKAARAIDHMGHQKSTATLGQQDSDSLLTSPNHLPMQVSLRGKGCFHSAFTSSPATLLSFTMVANCFEVSGLQVCNLLDHIKAPSSTGWPVITMGVNTIFKTKLFISSSKITSLPCRNLKGHICVLYLLLYAQNTFGGIYRAR